MNKFKVGDKVRLKSKLYDWNDIKPGKTAIVDNVFERCFTIQGASNCACFYENWDLVEPAYISNFNKALEGLK